MGGGSTDDSGGESGGEGAPVQAGNDARGEQLGLAAGAEEGPPTDAGEWVPYEGPRGESGWRDPETGEVVYDREPPGPAAGVDPAERPLSEGDRVLLEYDGEEHVGEVVKETDRDVRVRDDRNLWTLEKEEGQQIDGAMTVTNLGAPVSDRVDPAALQPETVEELTYVLNERRLEDAVGDVRASLGRMSVDEVVEAVRESDQSTQLVGSELMRAAAVGESGDLTVGADPDRGEPGALQSRFQEEHPDAARDHGRMESGWTGNMYRTSATGPLVQHAMAETGNETLPEYDDADRAAAADVTDAQLESARAVNEYTTKTLREAFGDEVTLFRGFSRNPHQGTASEGTETPTRLREAAANGASAAVGHRPVESWSFEPETARLYAGKDGAVVETTVPVEDVVMASSAGTVHRSESDAVVMHDGPETYDADQIHPGDDLYDEEPMLRLRLSAVQGTLKGSAGSGDGAVTDGGDA